MKEYLVLVGYAQAVYRKCELCKRVKDVTYRMDVKNAESPVMLVGSFDLCKNCAANMGEIVQKGAQMTQEILKYILEQTGGVIIALMLIMRIETKLDGLTAAIMRLSEAKSEQRRYTTDFYIYANGKINRRIH